MATAPAKSWTIDDLAAPPDDKRYEIWEGELIEMSPSGRQHSVIAMRIGSRMQLFVEQHDLGDVSGADGGYVISRDPDTLLVPDIAYVKPGRLSTDEGEGFALIPPDLAVEVVSPSDRMSEVLEKVNIYLAAGVQMVWVVLPRQRMVSVHRLDQPNVVQQVHEGDELDGGEILPGFRLPVAEIFRSY
jgi:Uma2 family endonuclease